MGDQGNAYIACQAADKIATFGVWIKRNPLNYSVPLILVQFSLISITSMLIDICLRPLGQSSMVTQIFVRILISVTFFFITCSLLSDSGIINR